VRFEVFTAVTMKNAVFWEIKTQFVSHKEIHYVSSRAPSRLMLCKIRRFHGGGYGEWDDTPCGSCKNRRFSGILPPSWGWYESAS
jgi:hypothetical protein